MKSSNEVTKLLNTLPGSFCPVGAHDPQGQAPVPSPISSALSLVWQHEGLPPGSSMSMGSWQDEGIPAGVTNHFTASDGGSGVLACEPVPVASPEGDGPWAVVAAGSEGSVASAGPAAHQQQPTTLAQQQGSQSQFHHHSPQQAASFQEALVKYGMETDPGQYIRDPLYTHLPVANISRHMQSLFEAAHKDDWCFGVPRGHNVAIANISWQCQQIAEVWLPHP